VIIYIISLHLSYRAAFCRQGIGCPKQEKVLTCEHTTLRRHAAAMHAVRFSLLILKPSHISLLASLQEVVQPE
jgi:hypothetical protein